jgi:hypothetical protein
MKLYIFMDPKFMWKSFIKFISNEFNPPYIKLHIVCKMQYVANLDQNNASIFLNHNCSGQTPKSRSKMLFTFGFVYGALYFCVKYSIIEYQMTKYDFSHK